MRVAILALVLSLFALLSSAAQKVAATDPQALLILQQTLAALSPNITARDLSLSGSAHYIAGSDDEMGTAVLKTTAIGSSRIDLSLSAGQRSEVYDFSAAIPAGQWLGADGSPHPVAYQNLVNEPGWFSPVTAIERRLAGSAFVSTYVAAETLDSQNVHHISITQPAQIPSASVSESQLLTHLTQVDFYIDSTTFLPAALSFSVHPDDNDLLDIPVQVRFSDYRLVNGVQIPFHIQKFLNNTLFLDLQLDNATINPGLPSTDFTVN